MSRRRKKRSSTPPIEKDGADKRVKTVRSRSRSERSNVLSQETQDATASNYSAMNDFGDAESQPANTSVPTVGKLPPILVKNIPLNELMRKLKFHSVTAEYKWCRIGIKVMVKTKPDYDKVKDYLLGIKAEFFSHDLPGEKPFKVVLRGLPNIETSEIATELTDHYKLQPSAVFRMTRRDEKSKVYRDSLYLIHFKKKISYIEFPTSHQIAFLRYCEVGALPWWPQ